MAFPTVLLAGAPKCATSSVYRWLVAQPDVVSGSRKELRYLMDEGNPLAHPKTNLARDGLAGYAKLFPSEAEATHRLDATTHYLYQAVAPKTVARLETHPKVLFVLREPAARVYTSFRFSQELLASLDRSLDFARYLDIVRRDPSQLSRYCNSAASRFVLEHDVEYGHYARYLDRWADAVGPDRMLVVLTEDLRTETEVTLARIGNFLDLGPESSVELRAEPGIRPSRLPTIRDLAAKATAWLAEHPRARQLVTQVYWSMQSRDAMPETTDADLATLAKLRAEYADSNAALARDYNLDLTSWYEERRPSLVD